MDQYVSNTTWREMADRIDAAERVALITHGKPDGDALGSVLALARALSAKGKIADIFLMGPLEPQLMRIAADTPYRRVENEMPGDDYHAIVIADTGAWSQLDPLGDWLKKHHDIAMVIDHHTQGDDVAALRMVDSKAASAASMIAELLDELGCELTGGVGSVAEAIYVGLATDTGWFCYQNAGADALALAARLLRAGVDKSRLYQIIEQSHRPQRLALEARALASIEYACDGAVAIQSLRHADFTDTECTVSDMANIVNLPMIVGSVRVSILLSEPEASLTKMSFRAKPGTDGEFMMDVNELARQFGGGGHVFAAGARMNAPLEETRRKLREALGG
jgi:phosphoesterase RecJ-like protein